MFAQVARFEFRYQLRNPVFWVAGVLFFLFAFGAMSADGLQFGSGGNVKANSPFAIAMTHAFFLILYMFVTTAFVANVVVRDDETGYGPMIRSTRITKASYLFGRFTGAFAAAALAYVSVPLGLWLGSLMPWVDAELLGPNRLAHYALPYLFIALPGILTMSAIFFALATATRSMMATYLGVVAFVILYITTNTLLRGRTDLERIRALVEPFGVGAYGLTARYWTAAERNANTVALDGLLLSNRLLWLGIALVLLGLAYAMYRFADRGISKRAARRQKRIEATAAPAMPPTGTPLPSADANAARAQFWSRTRLEIGQVVRSPAFAVLLLLGFLMTATILWSDSGRYGTQNIPVTRDTIRIIGGVFSLFPTIVATYYAGELVWRERDRKMHEIIDATPLPGWGYVVPKAIALSIVLLSMLALSVALAIAVQLLKGHTNLELGKYLVWYMLPVGAQLLLLAALAIFVQAMSPNKFVGWGVMVLYFVAGAVFGRLGLEHNLFLYGFAPAMVPTDFNGLSDFWVGHAWNVFYWAMIALVMLVAAHLLWRRGTETRFRPRLARGVARLRGAPGAIAGVALAAALLSGGWILYNTTVLNPYETHDDRDLWLANYEKRYLRYETLPQPSVSDVRLDVALYPADKRADVAGRYRLTNLTDRPVTQVHVRVPDERTALLALDFPGATLTRDDAEYRYRIYTLAAPMAPGDTRALSFRMRRDQQGFRDSGNDTAIVDNGTFLNSGSISPAIGMSREGLMPDRAHRRDHGLPAELRTAKLEDVSATKRPDFNQTWTTSDITVSTAADQTPIAPGKKVADAVANGRRTARFISDAPIASSFSIQSARYAEKHLNHRGVDLAVYYHPTHGQNVDRMIASMRNALDYYQANFGPYQFDQARIIEFPAYSDFAQAFANTMPYSEGFGFLADNRDPEKIDYTTYVVAHEVAHQYWGHQLRGADMQGSTMLTETLSQYSALMVMKRLYGPDKMRRFLKFELDAYLRSRGSEGIEELPLFRVENQQYIHYAKGSVVMYLLQDRLGEDAVNRALARVLAKYRLKSAPYPRSIELVDAIKAEAKTPEDRALVEDVMQRITVYDLRVENSTAVRRPDGRWNVTVPIAATKFYADGKGEDRETPLSDRIAVGLFTAEPGRGAFDAKNVVMMERLPVRSGRQVLRFITAIKPTHAGVDPYNLYIDRNSGDNVRPVS